MICQRLKQYLDKHKIQYTVVSHSPAFTAQEIAESAHISGKEIAKTVLLRVDRQMVMVVLPASLRINFEFFKELFATQDIRLAAQVELAQAFPDCELGAMPPFGNLYFIDVYVAQALAEDEEIAFNAGDFRQLVRMKYKDFDRLVRPVTLDLASAPV